MIAKTLQAFVVAGIGTFVQPCIAAAVPYQFSGLVSSVAEPLSSEFSVGEEIRGRVLIESDPFQASQAVSFYQVTGFNAHVGADYVIRSTGGILSTANDFGGLVDRVQLDLGIQTGLSAPSIMGQNVDRLAFDLNYELGDLTSTDLRNQFAPASMFDGSEFRYGGDNALKVEFELSDFSLVPEPIASPLFLIGGCILLMGRFRLRVDTM